MNDLLFSFHILTWPQGPDGRYRFSPKNQYSENGSEPLRKYSDTWGDARIGSRSLQAVKKIKRGLPGYSIFNCNRGEFHRLNTFLGHQVLGQGLELFAFAMDKDHFQTAVMGYMGME